VDTIQFKVVLEFFTSLTKCRAVEEKETAAVVVAAAINGPLPTQRPAAGSSTTAAARYAEAKFAS